jgi:hypothetical protein
MRDCLKREFDQNLRDLAGDLQKAVAIGPLVGVSVCGLVVACEPALLPLFPQCAGVTTVATSEALALAAAQRFNIRTAASVVGCALGCNGY